MSQDRPTQLQLFLSFLKLGCVAFGGPVAHLGYFQEEFVRKRKWISESEYADLVALCQFLPGPASSQVGFAIGHHQGGIAGAFLAWMGFTLPSAVIMVGMAVGLSTLEDLRGTGWIAGLKLAAVAVVANAIWSMAAKLCPDRERALIALGSATVLLVMADAFWQVAVIAVGALLGWLLFQGKASGQSASMTDQQTRAGWPYLVTFGLLLIGLPVAREVHPGGLVEVTEGFYRAGSLVFGGGHVVLPLLDSFTVGQGWVDQDTFLAGYGAAQALPGPLFAFTGFLGASINTGPGGVAGGVLALIATYAPSWLLVLGAIPYWERLRRLKSAQAALMGTNAAVVGLLLAAFYDPVWTVAITDSTRLAFALVVFALLRFAATPPWLLVLLSAGIGFMVF
jgi:chromate transporter